MNRTAHDAETLANHRQILKRAARLRRFGYDSPTAIRFVLAQALPLDGAVLEIGTGKGRFLVELARYAGTITTVDIAAEEQQCARLSARYAGVEEKIRFVLRDAARLPWRAGAFDAAVTMNAIQILAREHRAEGKTHPRERYDFRKLQRSLRDRGLATRLCKGCNQQVLLALVPAAVG